MQNLGSSLARCACCPSRGRRPDAPGISARRKKVLICFPAIPPPVSADSRFAKPRNSPKGRFYVLFASTKRTGSSRRAATLSTPRDGSKLYRLCFFVTFPASVPKPVYGATHFFGCFEPVRKGSCSTDARLIFFENGLLYCKLTGACRIQKGWLLVIFVAVKIRFCNMLIRCLEISQAFSIYSKL